MLENLDLKKQLVYLHSLDDKTNKTVEDVAKEYDRIKADNIKRLDEITSAMSHYINTGRLREDFIDVSSIYFEYLEETRVHTLETSIDVFLQDENGFSVDTFLKFLNDHLVNNCVCLWFFVKSAVDKIEKN